MIEMIITIKILTIKKLTGILINTFTILPILLYLLSLLLLSFSSKIVNVFINIPVNFMIVKILIVIIISITQSLMKMIKAVMIINKIILARFIIKFNYELFVGRIQPISHHIFLSNGRERITTA